MKKIKMVNEEIVSEQIMGIIDAVIIVKGWCNKWVIQLFLTHRL